VKSNDALLLDATAQRYGQRPSAMVGIEDPYEAYCFDAAIALRGIEFEAGARRPKGEREEQTLTLGGGITLTGKLSGYTETYRRKMREQGIELD
jgi:hypothetical protein